MENVMIDIQKAADIQNDAFTKAVEKERALEKERLKGKEWQSINEALHGAWTMIMTMKISKPMSLAVKTLE